MKKKTKKKAVMGRPPVTNPRVKIPVSLEGKALKVADKYAKRFTEGKRSTAINEIILQWDKMERNCNNDW